MAVSDFARPYPVQFRGSRFARWLLAAAGWQVKFDGFPASQGVLAVYPHTSNWDFVVAILAKWSLGVPVRFWGKDRLFRFPLFGRWLRWLGGIPVDRSSSHGLVGHTVEEFRVARREGRFCWLAVAPEGTRRAVAGWRLGFYQTALLADVPLGLVRLDFGRREVTVQDFIRVCGDKELDFARMAAVFEGVQGQHPALAAPVRPRPAVKEIPSIHE